MRDSLALAIGKPRLRDLKAQLEHGGAGPVRDRETFLRNHAPEIAGLRNPLADSVER